jgi:hypothetical protein
MNTYGKYPSMKDLGPERERRIQDELERFRERNIHRSNPHYVIESYKTEFIELSEQEISPEAISAEEDSLTNKPKQRKVTRFFKLT